MNNKVIVIGSANVDFIMKLPRLPKVGESVTNGEFMQTFGGKGANQAVAAARAGGNVWFVNCVGDDEYGPMIQQNLRDAGAHTDFMWSVEGDSSGIAVVLIGEQGKNLPTIDPGANYALTPDLVQSIADALSDAAMFVLQYEMPEETLYTAIDIAKKANIPIIFNYAPPSPIDLSKIVHVDYLILNETESEFLLGMPVGDQSSVEKAAQTLLGMGFQTVIFTLGDRGAFIAQEHGMESIPAFSVEAVDTTGAGDTFCGTLAVALVEGKPLLEAVQFANAAAALCVTKLGAQPSIPTRKKIESFLQQQQGEA